MWGKLDRCRWGKRIEKVACLLLAPLPLHCTWNTSASLFLFVIKVKIQYIIMLLKVKSKDLFLQEITQKYRIVLVFHELKKFQKLQESKYIQKYVYILGIWMYLFNPLPSCKSLIVHVIPVPNEENILYTILCSCHHNIDRRSLLIPSNQINYTWVPR